MQENVARNKTERKNTRKKEKVQNSKYAAVRRITGRFAKRFSGERPVSLGFELTFLSEFREFVWRVLDRDAKRRACIVKHPPKCHLEFTMAFYLILTVKSCIIEKTNIVTIGRVFYEKKTCFDYMFIFFILPDDFFGV